ncbi:MBL fold metallo-hydrolase [Nocardia sp. NPDC055165]
MKLRWGRPDISVHNTSATTPLAAPNSPVTVSFLGVTTLLFDDGESALMTDGFFTRPSLWRTALTPLRTDPARVHSALARAGVRSLDAVVCGHSHYDHALDSAYVAQHTGAILVGSESTAQIGHGADLPFSRVVVVEAGTDITLGNFTLSFAESEHSEPDRARGVIGRALAQPARMRDYKCGETWSIILTHTPSGRTALIHSSAGFRPGMLDSRSADVAYLSVGQLGHQPCGFIEHYWSETVTAVGAQRVVLTHWDDFFRPLSKPLRALPYAADDLDASVRVLSDCARRDAVHLDMPTVWRRTDPWQM